MTPTQFLARISALIPPALPVAALRRGARAELVLAPGGCRVQPRNPEAGRARGGEAREEEEQDERCRGARPRPARGRRAVPAEPAHEPRRGVVPPCYARLDWASLLKRVYFADVLAGPCGGRRPILAHVTEPETIVEILEHLGLPTEAPPMARARYPDVDPA